MSEWLQMNEANGAEKAIAVLVMKTVEREGFFEFICGIDALKNRVDKFK